METDKNVDPRSHANLIMNTKSSGPLAGVEETGAEQITPSSFPASMPFTSSKWSLFTECEQVAIIPKRLLQGERIMVVITNIYYMLTVCFLTALHVLI